MVELIKLKLIYSFVIHDFKTNSTEHISDKGKSWVSHCKLIINKIIENPLVSMGLYYDVFRVVLKSVSKLLSIADASLKTHSILYT